MKFIKAAAMALLASTALASVSFADEGTVPLDGFPKLDHVFVIVMENHGYAEVIGNPEMPYTNALAASANAATNYFAVAHPSLTNYLEIVGGSNFGILNDNSPIWGSTSCVSTLTPAGATNEASTVNNCPLTGSGIDTATPLIDYTNETSGPPGNIEIDNVHQYPAASTVAKTIAQQLVEANLTWKTYQQSLPISGDYGVTTSDGNFTDITPLDAAEKAAGETNSVTALYRAKHNPFEYFLDIEQTASNGHTPGVAPWDGAGGLFADLGSGHVPSFSFIVPDQCHDQHGTGGYQFCSGDPNDNGTLVGLNPGLMAAGDQTIEELVTAIKASPAWAPQKKSAIFIVWDEDDYSTGNVLNQVPLIVVKNYGSQGVQSANFYTHFSLLKTIEAGLRLPCLNHACDTSTKIMYSLMK